MSGTSPVQETIAELNSAGQMFICSLSPLSGECYREMIGCCCIEHWRKLIILYCFQLDFRAGLGTEYYL